ncbi:MAG: twin-arginine translocation signal domain-containing protein [Eggerthellaceae bacterium]|nr:twin-arginine translocation signal domain-containing protein [Eggerthellaceae bacterium]
MSEERSQQGISRRGFLKTTAATAWAPAPSR